MSITWYKLKIKKQISEYECYIRFKFDFQMQSIRIKAFIYLIDSEGNICVTEKKNKLGYDPRILGSLTVEKNFLKHKRKNNSNSKAKYYEVMKYQGNFNICNLPLIDDYFRNGKALFYQYKNMLYLMDNKKYKIQIEPKKFTLILEVINYGYISLNLFNKLEEVEKQELIFLKQNEDALCHRYFSNKIQNPKNKKDGDEIEIIEENKNFNQLGGRICIGGDENENLNIEEEKEERENDNINFEQNDEYEENSDDSSFYDSIFSTNGNKNNEKLTINNNKFFLNGKDFSNDNPSCNVILNGNQNSNKKINKSKSRYLNNNFNNNTFTNNSNNNENYNNFFIKLKKEENNITNISKINNQNQKVSKNANNKDLNFFEKAKNIVNKYNRQKDINTSETNPNKSKKSKNDKNIDNNKHFNMLCNRIISQKANDTLISNETERKILLCSSGFDNNKYNLKLLYKSTIHGDNVLNFHNKCDNIKNTILIILTLDNKKIGFFTSVGLSSDKKIIYDDSAFLFKLYKSEIDCFHIKHGEVAFFGKKDYILYLGGDQLIIRDNFLSGASSCGIKMKNYKINNNYQMNNGNKNFIIKELEVYIINEI